MQRRLPLIALVLVIVFALVFWLRREELPGGVNAPTSSSTGAARSSNELGSLTESTPAGSRMATPSTNESARATVENTSGPSWTGVRVRVLALEDERPLQNAQVRIRIPGARQSWADVERSHGTLAEEVRTDSDGVAEIEMDAGVLFSVHVQGLRGDAGSTSVSVDPALTSGEVRELTARIPTALDIDLHGQVTDRETGAPIADARVGKLTGWSKLDEAEAQHTGADGRFRAQGATWKRSVLNVLADGYELAVIALVSGHDTEANELKIELSRVASLRVTVRDESNAALSGLRVTLSTAQYRFGRPDGSAVIDAGMIEDAIWAAKTGADGVAVLEGLPARMPFDGVVSNGREELWRTPSPLTFDPEESRAVEWKIGGGCAIHGVVLEMDGRVVPRQAVCIQLMRVGGPTFFTPFEDDGRRTIQSDDEGRFVFRGVAPGDWMVGPAPAPTKFPKEVAPDEPAPFGQLVTIAPRTARTDVEVRLQRGLAIRGRVLAPSGNAAKHAYVSAESADGHLRMSVNMNGAEGLFVLGPLLDSEYVLRASAMDRFVDSDPVRARPGDTDVVLQLRAGGTLRGLVVDKETGAPVKAKCLLHPHTPLVWDMRGVGTDENGVFEVSGLDKGLYSFAATTTNGRIGLLSSIDVPAGSTVDGLRIEVEPGATVRVRYEGPRPFTSFTLFAGEAAIGGDGITKGTDHSFLAPAGRIVVRATHFPEREDFDFALTLTVGETRDVVFDGAWK